MLQVVCDSSFLEIEPSTLTDILDMQNVNIVSELEMFYALERYANKRGAESDIEEKISPDLEKLPTDKENTLEMDTEYSIVDTDVLREAVKKICFLDMRSTEFAAGPAKSKLLSKDEKLAIFMKLCSRDKECKLPDGFRTEKRQYEARGKILIMKC